MQNRKIIFVEGITDKLFFENRTKNIIINQLGNGMTLYTLFLVNYAGLENKNINYILDGDGKLVKDNELQSKLKKFLKEKGINNYFFNETIEKDLFKSTNSKLSSFETFNLAMENKDNFSLDISEELKKLL